MFASGFAPAILAFMVIRRGTKRGTYSLGKKLFPSLDTLYAMMSLDHRTFNCSFVIHEGCMRPGGASSDHGRKEKGAITASGRTPRILVVDSNKAVCEATSEVVESLGYPATCETESRKALSIFSDNPDEFDLAIIEPRMPELAGVDLAIALRRIRPSFPLLFYAGYLDYPSKQRIEIDCPAPVAIKPMTSHELLEAIEGAFRKSRI